MRVDEFINQSITPFADSLAALVFYELPLGSIGKAKVVVLVLLLSAVWFSFYFRFVNISGLSKAWRTLLRKRDEKAPGEISHFQALSAAVSGTVGLGNIAGVAVAITYGGPGVAFWMTIAAFFAMALKFAECSLGNKYRVIAKDGTVLGGGMYYISRGMEEHGLRTLGKWLGAAFAVFCFIGAIGAGNMFQVNQAYSQLVAVSGGESSYFADKAWLFGLTIAILVGVIIIYGVKGIVRVTARLVPLMGAIYVLAAVAVIIVNREHIGIALQAIIAEAFTPKAEIGGALGVMIWGFQRAAFSNEAGLGTAPAVYAAVATKNPLSVGYLSLLEPLIDTIIICNLTALVILVSGVELNGLGGIEVTSAAFATVFSWFPYVLALAVILFAFSTLITWSYYGLQAWNYLFSEHKRMLITSGNFYKVLFCSCAILGATSDLKAIIKISDSTVFLMAMPNLIALYILAPQLRRLMGKAAAKV